MASGLDIHDIVPPWSAQRFAKEMLTVLKRAGTKGMSRDAVEIYCHNLKEIELLTTLNDLLADCKIDARWNAEKDKVTYIAREDYRPE